MERDTHAYLYDIIQSCRNISKFTANIDFQKYEADLLIKSAVARQFIIIGEALNRINRFDPVTYPIDCWNARKAGKEGRI
jgi:uncharacterized protein with HEPN domain